MFTNFTRVLKVKIIERHSKLFITQMFMLISTTKKALMLIVTLLYAVEKKMVTQPTLRMLQVHGETIDAILLQLPLLRCSNLLEMILNQMLFSGLEI
jgi:hypothetical protein